MAATEDKSDLETRVEVAEAAESKKRAKLDTETPDPEEDQGLKLLKANEIGNKSTKLPK